MTPEEAYQDVEKQLDYCLEIAEKLYIASPKDLPEELGNYLAPDFLSALKQIADACQKETTAYTNVFTGMAIKATYCNDVDIRYHQTGIQNQTDRPAGFNFRGLSEEIIYPWLTNRDFQTAKSGWQTRTMERPKPYLLSYEENIRNVKQPFLDCYNQVEENEQSGELAVIYLLWRQMQLRDANRIVIATPNIDDVLKITSFFEEHFNYHYRNSRGVSRLPTLAMYAIYQCLMSELGRFEGRELKPLEDHSAADAQTGALGDIEVVNEDGTVYEVLEIKHKLVVTKEMVISAKKKIQGSRVDRYYILTDSHEHEPSEEVRKEVTIVEERLGCQMIVNGIVPTIKYYLRLLRKPSDIFPFYAKLLESDRSIAYEQKDVWNKIVTGEL